MGSFIKYFSFFLPTEIRYAHELIDIRDLVNRLRTIFSLVGLTFSTSLDALADIQPQGEYGGYKIRKP